MVNYTVSDMLTRLRNALRVKKTKVIIRSTHITKSITEILKREGYIEESFERNRVSRSIRDIATKYSLPSIDTSLANTEIVGLNLPALDSIGRLSSKTSGPSEMRKTQLLDMGSGSAQPSKELHIFLKYEGKEMIPVLTHLKSISRPGVRFYANAQEIPQVLGGLGITILSTSRGILTDTEARSLGIGGEVLCMVW